MQIVCPSCTTSYEVSESAVGAGRKVRCVRCREIWLAAAQPAMAMETAQAQGGPAGHADSETRAGEPAPAPDLEDAAWGMDALPEPEPLPTGPRAAIASPALVPEDHADAPAFDHVPAPAEAEPRAAPAPPAGRARPAWPTVILSLLIVIGAILAWRAEVVRAMPQTASLFAAIGMPVNLRGLVFTDVRTTKEMQDGVPVLVVEGAVANVTGRPADVPRLRLAMRDAAGLEVYTWTAQPPSPTLAGGETQPFRTRLASPPAEGRDVLVRFLTRRDR
jgi:predicted Zn finger-like uncharacterized protein